MKIASSAERRAQLIAITRDLVRSEGMAALNLRTVAERDGSSTQAIYTLFGGKSGLIQALYERWVLELEQRLSRLSVVSTPDELMHRTAQIYREQALSDPELFRAGTTAVAAEADVLGMMFRSRTFAMFTEFVRALMNTKRFKACTDADIKATARSLWAAVHGVVLFEICAPLAGRSGAKLLDETVSIQLRGLMT